MSESTGTQTQQDEEQRRRAREAAAPVYDDSARQQQSALYEQIAARGPFRYDPDRDPLYAMTRDRYTQSGRLAMKDSMGQAAALTGGYGSSYSQAVGQQQYDASLRQLAEQLPELYEQAYQMYRDQGDALQQQADFLGQQADRDYDRYRDEMEDWQKEQTRQQEQESSAYDRAADAYARLYALIGTAGYIPSDEELAAAGMTQEAADALRREYLRKTGQPGWRVNTAEQRSQPAAAGSAAAQSAGGGKLSLSDMLQELRSLKTDRQRQALYDAGLQAVDQGKASFTKKELSDLLRRHS